MNIARQQVYQRLLALLINDKRVHEQTIVSVRQGLRNSGYNHVPGRYKSDITYHDDALEVIDELIDLLRELQNVDKKGIDHEID